VEEDPCSLGGQPERRRAGGATGPVQQHVDVAAVPTTANPGTYGGVTRNRGAFPAGIRVSTNSVSTVDTSTVT
jgi:hypothetical protein